MSARELMLGRIRAALADVPAGEPPAWDPTRDSDPAAAYHRTVTFADPVDLFAQRCGAYQATVTRVNAGQIAAAIQQICQRHAVHELVVAPGLNTAAPPEVSTRTDDPPLTHEELDRTDGVLTGCALAIAQTGTIVLDTGPGQGRRALTLLPDLHICLLHAQQIIATVPEAIARLHHSAHARHPITFISGPSATSDIELTRVHGVHGPRHLEVVLAAQSDT